MLTDVVNSTAAIEERYREVNLLGAASIVTAQQTCGRLPFPTPLVEMALCWPSQGTSRPSSPRRFSDCPPSRESVLTSGSEWVAYPSRWSATPGGRQRLQVPAPLGIDLALFQGGEVALCESLVRRRSYLSAAASGGSGRVVGCAQLSVQPPLATERSSRCWSAAVNLPLMGRSLSPAERDRRLYRLRHPLRPDDLKPSLPTQSASDDARLAVGGIAKLIRRGKSLAGYSAMAAGLGGPLFRTMAPTATTTSSTTCCGSF